MICFRYKKYNTVKEGRPVFRHRIHISKIQKRMFFLSFVTAFIAVFTMTLAFLIDNVIVCAFYGEAEIAAISLANPFFFLLEIPAAGLAAGLQTVCARDLGAGKIDKVDRQFNQIFFFAAALLTLLTVLSFLSVPRMAVLFGGRGRTAALQPLAAQYLYGLSFEIVPYVLFCIMTPVVILDNGNKLISIASVCGCVTDIVLDLLSVRFGWGLFGIGLASSASALVYFMVSMMHFLSHDKVIRLHFVMIRFRELKEIFLSSAPKAFLSLADTFRSLLFLSLVSFTGGMAGTFVYSLHGTVSYTVLIIAEGVAGAVGMMTGICCGEKNGEDLAGVGVLAHRYNLILSVCSIAILAVSAYPLCTALTENNESAELLMFALICIMFTVPLTIMIHCRISYLQAVGLIREAQWMGISSNLTVLTMSACLLALRFGVRGVFMAFPVSQIAILIFSWLLHWKRTGKILPAVSDYLEVDDSFYPKPGDVISYPVATMEDCALAGEQVTLFCKGHRTDEKKGFLAGLCVEELTTNVIEHGIKPGQSINMADIRVVIDGEDVIIRTRDGGSAFNLKRFADRLEKETPESGTGIRILLNSAKNISYYRTYGMNTTIIRV